MDAIQSERVHELLKSARESLRHLKYIHSAMTASRFVEQAENALRTGGTHTAAAPAEALTAIVQAMLLLSATVSIGDAPDITGTDHNMPGLRSEVELTLTLLREAQAILRSPAAAN